LCTGDLWALFFFYNFFNVFFFQRFHCERARACSNLLNLQLLCETDPHHKWHAWPEQKIVMGLEKEEPSSSRIIVLLIIRIDLSLFMIYNYFLKKYIYPDRTPTLIYYILVYTRLMLYPGIEYSSRQVLLYYTGYASSAGRRLRFIFVYLKWGSAAPFLNLLLILCDLIFCQLCCAPTGICEP
jgi:hypothetical protein